MIIDEKVIMYPPSPPPYRPASPSPNSPSPNSNSNSASASASRASSISDSARAHNPHANLALLPAHILLQIIYHCFPPDPSLPPPPAYFSRNPFSASPSPSASSPSSPASASFSSSSSSSAAAAAVYARHYAEQLRLYQDTHPEKQRKTLYWLASSLRLVSRTLYTACMHVLRSTYLPAYQSLIRAPYSSDPFPLSVPTMSGGGGTTVVGGGGGGGGGGGATAPSSSSIVSTTGPPEYDGLPPTPTSPTPIFPPSRPHPQPHPPSPLLTPHRETAILDRFIALKVRQDVLADESELHLDREDSFRDLFEVAQPRARLEDLVRVYGVREGVVCVPGEWGGGGGASSGGAGGGGAGGGGASGGGQAQGWGGGQAQGQEREVYRSQSRSSSLVSLPSPPPTPSSSSSSSTAKPPPPHPPPQPKSRRSLFSFGIGSSKKPSSPFPHPSSSHTQTSSHTHPHPHQQTYHPHPQIQQIHPIPFPALSISFSPRRVGLVLNRSRTIAEVNRLGAGAGGRGTTGREREPLEVLARALVRELRGALGG